MSTAFSDSSLREVPPLGIPLLPNTIRAAIFPQLPVQRVMGHVNNAARLGICLGPLWPLLAPLPNSTIDESERQSLPSL